MSSAERDALAAKVRDALEAVNAALDAVDDEIHERHANVPDETVLSLLDAQGNLKEANTTLRAARRLAHSQA
jgi:transposase